MQELIKVEVNDNQEPIVSARELHKVLGVSKRFSMWWETQIGYGFTENEDYVGCTCRYAANQYGGEQELQDYAMKLDMAKELAMVSKTEKGKEVRKYFIQVEKDFNSPEKIMAKALKIAENTINTLSTKIEEQRPLVEFAETVANSSDNIDMNEMAKICNKENVLINGKTVGRNKLFKWLKEHGILMDNGLPYQKYIDSKLFSVIEVVKKTAYGENTYRKVLVSGKGQIKIVEMIRSEMNGTQL